MSDDSTDAWKAAVLAAVPLTFERCYQATVIEQADDGTLTVRADDEAIGELAKVPLLVGCPSMAVKMPEGSRVRLYFAGGDPVGYFAVGIEQDVEATKSVARVGDPIDCGTVVVASGPGGVLITYTPPGGAPSSVTIVGSITAASTTFKLRGKVTDGHPRVMLTAEGQ